jgi:tetratricopeptide (TPR) repeat protein
LDRECAATARRHVIAEGEGNSHVNLIFDYTHCGDFEKAAAAISEAEAVRDRDPWMQWRYFGIRLPANAAEHWLKRGDLAQARSYAETLLENATRTQARKYIAIAHQLRAEIARRAGDHLAAEEQLSAALKVLQGYSSPLVEWKIYASLGQFRAQAGQTRAAREAYHSAALIVGQISASIRDEKLRYTFSNSAAVRAVLQHD